MKLIHFFTKADPAIGEPVPIKTLVPEWYKKAESSYVKDGEINPGLKKCIPYLDALVSGYTYVTPFDITVARDENNELKITWNGPPAQAGFVGERPNELGETMPRPDGYLKNHLIWSGFWGVKTPRGWSLLFTHPLNRQDLPFLTMSGIVDSDEFSASGNIPFFIKENFQGIIPAGTPICQLIPIKRSSWKMIINKGMKQVEDIQGMLVRESEKTSYKKIFWKRKEYN